MFLRALAGGGEFKGPRPLRDPVKLVYCPADHAVSLRSRLERMRCDACGGPVHLITVPYPWQYWTGVGLVLGGAIFILLPQFIGGLSWAPYVATVADRVLWLVPFVGFGLYLTSWAVRVMKARALEEGMKRYPGEAEA